MQVRPTATKPKYKIKDFTAPGNHPTNKVIYTNSPKTTQLQCICKQFCKSQTKKCYRCGAIFHKCLVKNINKDKEWQCLHCDGLYMDPIFSVDQILIQTFIKTDSVYHYSNLFELHFTLENSQLNNPVQIRCLQLQRGPVLAWPMQGQLYINQLQNSEPITDFKPLLSNSNRKHRKQQPIIIPANKLKYGHNVLTFSIPRLNKILFSQKYQCDERAIYYMAIYSIKKLTKQQLISKTIKKNRIDKEASITLFRKLIDNGDSQLSVQKIKLCLQCPYTKSRIKIPVRGKMCTHYTCLCLDTLIQTRMGMNTREWSCPICSNKINEPIIDNFILSMLNDGSAGVEVMLSIDGSYYWIKSNQNQISLDSDDDSLVLNKQEKDIIKNSEIRKNIKIEKKGEGDKISEVPPPKPIETIDLDDDSPVVPSDKKLPELQILIPNQIRKDPQSNIFQNKLPSVICDKVPQKKNNRNKQKEKQRKPKNGNNSIYNYFNKSQRNQSQMFITDIKELDFRSISHNQFVKKYFSIEHSRAKVHDDLKAIFKEVL